MVGWLQANSNLTEMAAMAPAFCWLTTLEGGVYAEWFTTTTTTTLDPNRIRTKDEFMVENNVTCKTQTGKTCKFPFWHDEGTGEGYLYKSCAERGVPNCPGSIPILPATSDGRWTTWCATETGSKCDGSVGGPNCEGSAWGYCNNNATSAPMGRAKK